jgi:hypothetical protein
MENSGKIFFEDDGPHWFVASGDHWLGPLSAADVYAQILAGKLTWAHFVWRTGQKSWTRVCDTLTFQVAVPQLPGQDVLAKLKQAATPEVKPAAKGRGGPPPTPKDAEQEKPWFLFYADSQYGPFSQEEVERFLQAGRIHSRVHIWKDGMGGWERLENISTFKSAVAQARPQLGVPEDTATRIQREQRSAPRAPLVAKIILASDENVSVAICRDISVGGMQVLTDRIPGPVGSKVKLNVSSTENTGKLPLDPFVAEGVVVRILEDRRGFSFRFDKLPESARKAIEAYIGSL